LTACSAKLAVRLALAGFALAETRAAAAEESQAAVKQALGRMYNFDFDGADRILDAHIRAQPEEPLGYTFRAASLLFRELDRLKILEGEFFSDDKRLIAKERLEADPKVGRQFYEFVEMGRRRARHRLATNPSDPSSLFAMCIGAGLVTDYVGLVERKQLGSLTHAKESQSYAVRLLKVDPTFTDAYMTTGLTEYLLGSVPFFVKWFVKFEGAEGDKNKAVRNLETVTRTGRYLGPFAKILLSIIHLREKRAGECERLLSELARDFPENQLIRKELAKVSALQKNTASP
jgi:hypothetical protein